MKDLIESARRCMECKQYISALLTVLTIPDACGAVQYPEISGRGANGKRARKWFEAFVDGPKLNFDANVAWAARNPVMHEVRVDWRGNFGFGKLVFCLPGQIDVHDCGPSDDYRVVSLQQIVDEITSAALSWLEGALTDPTTRERAEGLLQFRPDGDGSLVLGIPVIA